MDLSLRVLDIDPRQIDEGKNWDELVYAKLSQRVDHPCVLRQGDAKYKIHILLEDIYNLDLQEKEVEMMEKIQELRLLVLNLGGRDILSHPWGLPIPTRGEWR